jgi:hypothetical protein
MNELIVSIGASCVYGTLKEYLAQLVAAGIDVQVEDISALPHLNAGANLGIKVKAFRAMAGKFRNYERIVFSDGFDVQFWGTIEDVLSKIPTDHVLCAAEKNFYPPEPETQQRVNKRTLWPYFNGGLSCGTPDSYLRWLDMVESHPEYNPLMIDQLFFNRRLAEKSELAIIDDETRLFYCALWDVGELEFERGIPINRVTGNRPNFIHFNGKQDPSEILARRARSL